MAFNFLSLSDRKAIIFPEAQLVYSNANEAFRIAYFSHNGKLYEVCYDLASNSIEDIRMLEQENAQLVENLIN